MIADIAAAIAVAAAAEPKQYIVEVLDCPGTRLREVSHPNVRLGSRHWHRIVVELVLAT